ncbi:MAG: hypothetical protein JNM26_09830, partial [Ideonella sp.]|nr:hypothetical protein [Ideonella sp.]
MIGAVMARSAPAVLCMHLFPLAALAAECSGIASDVDRLRCYDEAARVKQAPPPATPVPSAPVAQGPEWVERLRIRDALEGSKKGAALTATREKGDTNYRVKAAVIFDAGNNYLPEIAQIYNWSWKAGAQLSKDSSPTKPVDGRSLKFGASGNLLPGTPFQLTSYIDVTAVTDRVARTRDLGLRYRGEWRILDSGVLES